MNTLQKRKSVIFFFEDPAADPAAVLIAVNECVWTRSLVLDAAVFRYEQEDYSG